MQATLEQSYYESTLGVSTFLATRAKVTRGVESADQSTDEPSKLIETIATKIELLSPIEDEELIRQGESAAGLFIVTKGHCNCFIDSPDEPTGLKLVKVVQVGDHFGELSLLEPGVATRAHVWAGPATRVALLVPSAFEEVCTIEPGFRAALMQSVAKYQHFNFFSTLPLLKSAAVELVQELVGAAKSVTYPASTHLIRAAALSEALYIIRSGTIILRAVPESEPQSPPAPGSKEIALGPSDHFGGEALFEHQSVHDVYCQSECSLFELDLAGLTHLAERYPALLECIQQELRPEYRQGWTTEIDLVALTQDGAADEDSLKQLAEGAAGGVSGEQLSAALSAMTSRMASSLDQVSCGYTRSPTPAHE